MQQYVYFATMEFTGRKIYLMYLFTIAVKVDSPVSFRFEYFTCPSLASLQVMQLECIGKI